MASPLTKKQDTLVLVTKQTGFTVIPASTPLTRLNYFDGKFLRADDLRAEQQYLRRLVELSNQADGPGIAHGFDTTLGSGDTLKVSPGLAVDPGGRLLLLPQEAVVDIEDLIERSRKTSLRTPSSVKPAGSGFDDCITVTETSATPVPSQDLYLITISHAEALCGEEDVFGKLCEEACVTSTDRPYVVEGVVIRAVPLTLSTPLATSTAETLGLTHRRSLVASAYFRSEEREIADLIDGPGLRSRIWCFGAAPVSGVEVPIAVIQRAGTSTVFLDEWTARRERIDTSPRRYWQWRMAMRPWDVFLAQILQFQCQLPDALGVTGVGGADDPCNQARALLVEASLAYSELTRYYAETSTRFVRDFDRETEREFTLVKGGLSFVSAFEKKLQQAKDAIQLVPTARLLIRGGIVELPSAGYLPVAPGSAITVNSQVRALMGEGVDLHFCVVRPDYVAHALEEAQHMERISLLQGLDNPRNKPEVDILVPNGEILSDKRVASGKGFETDVVLLPPLVEAISDLFTNSAEVRDSDANRKEHPSISFRSVTRTDAPSGRGALYSAGLHRTLDARARADISGERALGDVFIGGLGAGTAKGPESEGGEEGARLKNVVGELFRAARREREALAAEVAVVTDIQVQQPAIGYWLAATSEKNVFSLIANQATRVDGRAVVATSHSRFSAYVDANIRGEFVAKEAIVNPAGGRSVKGILSVLASLTVGTDSGKQSEAGAFELKAGITLTHLEGSDSVVVAVQGDDGNDTLVFRAEWSGEPLKISASAGLSTRDSKDEIRSLESRLVASTAVFETDNETRQLAVAGIQVVGKALGDLSFVDVASGLLFPPPPVEGEALVVKATEDWVLFHRRRTKRCELEAPPRPLAPPRSYQVFHLSIANAEQLRFVREALQRNDSAVLSRFKFVPVGIVEFGGGVAALLSDRSDLASDWRAVNPGDVLGYEAIASERAAAEEGSTLALSRLDRVENAVSAVSRPGSDTIVEILPSVPTPLASAGTDGVIVLMTAVVESVCHTVARVNRDLLERVLDLARRGNFEAIFPRLAERVGNASFRKNTSEVVEDSLPPLIQRWNELGGGLPSETLVVSREGESPEVVSLHIQQAQRIQQALGRVVTPQPVFAPVQIPECPVMTFVTFSGVGSSNGVTEGEPAPRGRVSGGPARTSAARPASDAESAAKKGSRTKAAKRAASSSRRGTASRGTVKKPKG